MTIIYVAKLISNKYYIGETNNITTLKKKLKIVSKWTTKYKPIAIIEEYSTGMDKSSLTKIYMEKYGIDNVRGGPYCTIELNNNTKESIKKYLSLVNDQMSNEEKIIIWKEKIEENRQKFWEERMIENYESINITRRQEVFVEQSEYYFDDDYNEKINKKIKCPICREFDIITEKTIKIKGQLNDCCICMINKSELLCSKCHTVNICMECCFKL